jgi:hypothetical protein
MQGWKNREQQAWHKSTHKYQRCYFQDKKKHERFSYVRLLFYPT